MKTVSEIAKTLRLFGGKVGQTPLMEYIQSNFEPEFKHGKVRFYSDAAAEAIVKHYTENQPKKAASLEMRINHIEKMLEQICAELNIKES